MKKMTGKTKVGRLVWNGSFYQSPKIDNYTAIVVMNTGKWAGLSPYFLKTSEGYLHENVWQFSKVYPKIPEINDKKSGWKYKAVSHVVQESPDEILSGDFFEWRKKGFEFANPVRYPAGYHLRHTCIGAYIEGLEIGTKSLLDYIEARKRIYLPIYSEAARKTTEYKELCRLLKSGVNLLILEIDGPHQESNDYYAEKYGIRDLVQNQTVDITPETIKILLNDPKHPFGHGYCLAVCLESDVNGVVF